VSGANCFFFAAGQGAAIRDEIRKLGVEHLAGRPDGRQVWLAFDQVGALVPARTVIPVLNVVVLRLRGGQHLVRLDWRDAYDDR
jgi:hypothetical protein